jgi:hypothetical protein
MTPGPGHDLTPSAAGRGHLRTSHADRERVVELLKAAFVQGRLTKEELEARAGQALGSRTYAELAGLTADLPDVPAPRRPARARATRLPMGKVALVGAGVLGPPAILAAAILTNNEGLAKVFMLVFPWYFMGWLAAVLQILDNLRKRSRRQLPPGPAQPGWAFDGEQDGETGDDLILAEARVNGRDDGGPGCHGSKCARAPRPARLARRTPAGRRCTA